MRRRPDVPAIGAAAVALNVEVLYFEGCPSHEAFLPRLKALLAGAKVATDVTLVDVPDDEAAQRERFLGSPTIRVDGRDIEPGADARTDYGLKCRLYRTPDGLGGTPPDAWLVAALSPPEHDGHDAAGTRPAPRLSTT